MQVARVNGRTVAVLGSFSGLGGTIPVPGLGDLIDVDLGGISDGDTIVWDDATDTFVPGTSGPGGSMPWFDMMVDGGLVGDGTTDDTVAFQAAIDTGTASGTRSCTFYFPPGTYLVGGALQDTGAKNGQILLPTVSASDEQITITFLGAARPPVAVHGPIPTPNGYSIIKSTLTGASGTAACISAGNEVWTSVNNISVVVQDLICLAPTNPTFTFWNLSSTQGGAPARDLMISTTWWGVGSATQPTHSNAYGIKFPGRGDSNYTYIDGICVYGFYTGMLLGELCIARGIVVSHCIVGVEVASCPHPLMIVTMQNTACQTGIKITAGSFDTYMDVLQYSAEHYSTPAWAVTTYDLDDGSNVMHGNVRWLGITFTGTNDHSFTINGGADVSDQEIGPLSGGPPTGSAGGDLSGTYPNPSVVDDSHSHTAATAPGGGGGGHYEVIVSGTAPPVAVTNVAEDDWVYGWVPD